MDTQLEIPSIAILAINFTVFVFGSFNQKQSGPNSLYRKPIFQKRPGLQYDKRRRVPYFIRPGFYDDKITKKAYLSVFIFDDASSTPIHDQCTDQCTHTCRDILLLKNVQPLFESDVGHPSTKIKSAFPNLEWSIPTYENQLVFPQSDPSKTGGPLQVVPSTDDIRINIDQLGGLVMFISYDNFEYHHENIFNPPNIDIMEFKNTFYQLLVRDPYTKNLPCWIFAVIKKGSRTSTPLSVLYEKLSKVLSFDKSSNLKKPPDFEYMNGMDLRDEKVRINIVTEDEIYPGSPIFSQLITKAFQQYQSKVKF